MADCSHCGLAPGAEHRLNTNHFWRSSHPSSTKMCFSSPNDIEDNRVNIIDFFQMSCRLKDNGMSFFDVCLQIEILLVW